MKRTVIISLVFLLHVVVVAVGKASDPRSNIRSIGMARNAVALSRGIESIGTNPANLALGDRNRMVTFTVLPPFGMSFGSDFINYEIYHDYFTGVDTGGAERASYKLTEADKDRILSIFPAGVAETHLDLDVRLFALTVHTDRLGSAGFAITERMAFNFDLPRDYVRFALRGLDSAGSSFNFNQTDVRAWWLREYSLSYARLLPDLVFARNVAAGISLKLIHGFGYIGTERYNANFASRRYVDELGPGYRLEGEIDFMLRRSGIDLFEEGKDGEKTSYTPFPTPAGTGFGVDLGVSGEVFPGIRAAFSLTDIGSISWKRNTRAHVGSGSFSITSPSQREQQERLEDAFEGEERELGSFSTALAAGTRIGGSMQLDQTPWFPNFYGRLLVALEYHQGFNNAPGNTTRPRIAFGAEYRPLRVLPIRTGISLGGVDRFNWAFGFGLDLSVFAFDLGTENLLMLFTPKSFDQLSVGMGMRWRI